MNTKYVMAVVMNSSSIGNRQLNCDFRDLNFEIEQNTSC